MSFLDAFHDSSFNAAVLRETYRNIKVILRSDKNLNNIADRTLLKCLGHWLGLQTLAKNKPILHSDLAIKELVLEAYFKGMQDLLYVVPFVSKVTTGMSCCPVLSCVLGAGVLGREQGLQTPEPLGNGNNASPSGTARNTRP